MFHLFAKRFVGGENFNSLIEESLYLTHKKFGITFNILGEHIKSENYVRDIKDEYIQLAHKIKEHSATFLSASISVKFTQLGLDIGEGVCKNTLLEILRNITVPLEIDREGQKYNYKTKKIIACIPEKYRHKVRICVQLNDPNGEQEILDNLKNGFRVRVVKGAGSYPGDTKNTTILRSRFLQIADNIHQLVQEVPLIHVKDFPLVAYATHDLYILDKIYIKYPNENYYIFQVLRGIENKYVEKFTNDFQQKIVIYFPYGKEWFSYDIRRITSILKIYIRNLRYRIFKV